MTDVTYVLGIPATNNNPSTDQPNMMANNDAVDTILAIDHVSFNATNGGTHKQVTFSSENTPGAQVDPISTLFTGAGVASSVAQMLYKNQNATLPISAIRAFGVFTVAGSVSALDNSYNVASISGPVSSTYTITLNSNVVTGNNICLFLQTNGSFSTSWTFANPVITLVAQGGAGTKVSFIVLQF